MTVFPESPFDWNFLKVGSVIVYNFIKNFPDLQDLPLPLPHLKAQAIKCVYVINYSRYVQKYDPVCIFRSFIYFGIVFIYQFLIKKYRNRNETRPGQVHAGSSFIILKYYSQNGLFAPFKLELMTLVQRLQMDIWCTHYMRPALRII